MIKVELIFANSEAERIKRVLAKKYDEKEDTPLCVLCEKAVLKEVYTKDKRSPQ